MPRTYKLAAKTRTTMPKAKPAPSQTRLKKAAAKTRAAKTRSITPYPLNAKAPLIKQGPLPGAGAATPGVRKKAPALTAKQKALVKSAMPKAKAQRTPAQIAAMHAYRASGGGQKRRAKGPSFPVVHTKGGHKKPRKSKKTTRTPGIPHSAYPR